MILNDLLKEKHITKYRLSRESGVPYATLSDICSERTPLPRCNAETVYRLAKGLDVPMERMLDPYFVARPSFELFKSDVCHRLKKLGDIKFAIELLEKDDIQKLFDMKWYPESLYLLGMLDYVCRINNMPTCSKYNKMRETKLSKIVYPQSLLWLATASNGQKVKEDALKNAIPELLRFNIVESEVRNVF